MPPKTSSGASKKVEMKKKEKIIEDKTFGLKNKKGSKNQKYIAQVQSQVKSGGPINAAKLEEEKRKAKEKKEAEEKAKKEMMSLFKPVQKIEKGADPKSVLCAFYKQGSCTKGEKCKFSHNLDIERKAEKRSLYVDMRAEEEGTSEDWDEEKLMSVIAKKHAEADKKVTTTIICKFFLDAVEKSKYGWFWQCPNGTACIYKHALPPGFVLNKDKKKEAKKDEISLEELVESERAGLGPNQTKVTLESFLAWKKRKLREREAARLEETDRKKKEFKAGKSHGLSGREMFTFNPDMATADQYDDGDEAFDTANLPSENGEGGDDQDANAIQFRELTLEDLAASATMADGANLTVASENRFLDNAATSAAASAQLDEAAGGDVGEATGGGGGVPIDENLFADEDDLEDLEDELEDLDVNE